MFTQREKHIVRSLFVALGMVGFVGVAHGADVTAPTITSILRQSPTAVTVDVAEVTFRVTFSEEVVNVNTGDFALSGTAAAKSDIATVTAISQLVYDVAVETADGTLSLVPRTASDNIEDLAGNDYDDAVGSTESYTVARVPVIVIDADTKIDTEAVTDVEIVVTDDTAITAANVTVDSSSTVIATALTCIQTTSVKVTCTVTVDGAGALVVRAVDGAGNATTTEETGFDIDDVVDVDTPKFKISGAKKREKLSHRSTNYFTKTSVTFSGTNEHLKGGKVKIYDNNDNLGEAKISTSNGDWSKSVSFKNSKSYKLKFKFYDKHGNKLDTKGTYKVFVDSEKPKFTDLPSKLTKRIGARIWWEVTDNHKIKRYRYFWLGRKTKTTDPFFSVPVGTPRGTYDLEVRAYDKAGNKTDKVISVTVR